MEIIHSKKLFSRLEVEDTIRKQLMTLSGLEEKQA
jgi:hypothetical protein